MSDALSWPQACDLVLAEALRQHQQRRVIQWTVPSKGMDEIKQIAKTRDVTEVDLVRAGGYPTWGWEDQ